jgi:hypothetical protein
MPDKLAMFDQMWQCYDSERLGAKSTLDDEIAVTVLNVSILMVVPCVSEQMN